MNKVAAVFVEICQKNGILCDFFPLNFSMKTARHLKVFLRQNSVTFGENFREIKQTAKISAQQRCHAARVFVTLATALATARAGYPWL